MPRKKADSATSPNDMVSTEGGQNRPTFAARYLRVALAHMNELIIRGDETEAQQVGAELEDFLRFQFRGVALESLLSTVGWVRERAQQLARLNAIELAAYDDAEKRFTEPTSHE